MVTFIRACVLIAICLGWVHITAYNIRNHPCCMEPNENLTLAMIIDAFEIYGHDPTDKLDNLWLYQNEMLRIKTAEDQYLINERVHIATDHLGRFVKLHIQELKVLLITLDDVIDNMLTMYENHNSIAAERRATYTGGPVPTEFYMSQEYYCGKNVYIFVSELYSDIYNMGRGVAPYCKERSFVFLGFLHYHDEQKYYLLDDPSISFPTDNFLHGLECHLGVCIFSDIYNMGRGVAPYCKDRSFVFLGFLHYHDEQKYYLLDDPSISFPTDNFLHSLECHLGVCIFRFPFKKLLQRDRDVTTLPKAIVKCGLVMYKLPPLTASSCIITSGSFILDFNIQGLRYRHHDYLLTIPNGQTYYTKERYTPLVCDHHVCEWNYTNHYGGPFLVPGDPGTGIDPVPPYVEPTPKPEEEDNGDNITVPYILEGCMFVYPPNYGSIAGKSYLDPVDLHDDRFTCNAGGKGLYWYPQWMGAMPAHAYEGTKDEYEPPGTFYPHQKNYDDAPED